MGLLSDFEDRVARAVEGLFAGAFRSPVQPAEIAKALSREMDDGRVVGISKVYAPVAYYVELSEEDFAKFGTFTQVLERELATYLADHARKREYQLTAAPTVAFSGNNELKLGKFLVWADLAAAKGGPVPGVQDSGADEDSRSSTTTVAPGASLPQPPTEQIPALATLSLGEGHHDVALRGESVVIGRLSDCDIALEDVNVSRRHSRLFSAQGGWWVEDLGSTNGTFVNGEQVTKKRLSDGDVLSVGTTRLVFHEP